MMISKELKETIAMYCATAQMVKKLGDEISNELEQIEPGLGFNDAVFNWLADVEDLQFESASEATSELENILEDVALEMSME